MKADLVFFDITKRDGTIHHLAADRNNFAELKLRIVNAKEVVCYA